MKVPYEDRFGTRVPEAAFPLPVGRVRPPAKIPAKLTAFLDFVEGYLRLTPEELATDKRFWPKSFGVRNDNRLVEHAHSTIKSYAVLHYHARTPIVEDQRYHPEDPKGPEFYEAHWRSLAEAHIKAVRDEDWALVVVMEYERALLGGRRECDEARRKAQGVPAGDALWFRPEDVASLMWMVKFGGEGLVDQALLFRLLAAEATSQAPVGVQ